MVDRCFKCGQRPAADSKLRVCGGCHTAKYCTDLCKRGHWSEHKPVCKTLGAARESAVSSLACAAQDGDLAAATKLLETGNANKAAADGRTALIMAAKSGHLDLVAALLEAGAKVNRTIAFLGRSTTPLVLAAGDGHLSVVNALLEAGAEIENAPDAGVTPLHVAAQGGHVAMVKVLLEAGADANKADHNGFTPLPRLQHRPAGGKVSGPSPLNTSRLGSVREIEVIFSPCASNWRGIGVCLPPMLSIARCSLNEPLRGTS